MRAIAMREKAGAVIVTRSFYRIRLAQARAQDVGALRITSLACPRLGLEQHAGRPMARAYFAGGNFSGCAGGLGTGNPAPKASCGFNFSSRISTSASSRKWAMYSGNCSPIAFWVRFLLISAAASAYFYLVGRKLLNQLDDVITVAGGDDAANLVGLQRKGGGFDFRHHLAARELVFAASAPGDGVFGEFVAPTWRSPPRHGRASIVHPCAGAWRFSARRRAARQSWDRGSAAEYGWHEQSPATRTAVGFSS